MVFVFLHILNCSNVCNNICNLLPSIWRALRNHVQTRSAVHSLDLTQPKNESLLFLSLVWTSCTTPVEIAHHHVRLTRQFLDRTSRSELYVKSVVLLTSGRVNQHHIQCHWEIWLLQEPYFSLVVVPTSFLIFVTMHQSTSFPSQPIISFKVYI